MISCQYSALSSYCKWAPTSINMRQQPASDLGHPILNCIKLKGYAGLDTTSTFNLNTDIAVIQYWNNPISNIKIFIAVFMSTSTFSSCPCPWTCLYTCPCPCQCQRPCSLIQIWTLTQRTWTPAPSSEYVLAKTRFQRYECRISVMSDFPLFSPISDFLTSDSI